RDAGVRRVVYAGSSSAYGNTPQLPKVETIPPAPLSPYAVSKVIGEMYCRIFNDLYGLETVVLRYFNVFGPRQDPNSEYAAVIPKFITALLEGRRPTIFGDGGQTRDFTHVDNVVDANLRACEKFGVAGHIINCACGERTSITALFEAITKAAGTTLPPIYGPAREGEVIHSFADITKAALLLGYTPKVSLFKGLGRTVVLYVAKDR
ncbi:MAG: NAD-dependent epimerase/dehydratase family protein, partial [Candidatus Hydrogenedentota bacterium]